MNVSKITSLVKTSNTPNHNKLVWTKSNEFNPRYSFEPFAVKNKLYGYILVSIEKYFEVFDRYAIKVKNPFGKVLGKEIIDLYKNYEKMYGYSMEVEAEYRSTNRKSIHKIGEILRLASIMLMNQNQKESIKIFSKKNAVYFHSKYKFEPDIQEFRDMRSTLETIIEDKSNNFKDLVEKAKILYTKIPTTDNFNNKNLYSTQVNSLVKEYINRVLMEGKNGEGHPFKKGFDMVLKAETLKSESDFFNKLYKKHEINYQI